MNPHAKAGRSFRSAELVRSTINIEARTAELSFSSDVPLTRGNWVEILSHKEGAVDLSRLNSGGAVLVGHNDADQVGVVLSSSIDGPTAKGRALAKFSKSVRGQEIFQDVIDGIRSLVSVGYEVKEWEAGEKRDGLETYTATRWQPLEISIVSIPADTTVGVGRGDTNKTEEAVKPILKMSEVIVTEKPIAPDLVAERKRSKEINAIGAKWSVAQADVDAAIEAGTDVRDFAAAVLEKRGAKPVTQDAKIGMSEKEVREFSLVDAINDASRNSGKPTGMYKEISDQVAKNTRTTPEGFLIPHDVLLARSKGKRDLQVLDATKGGYLVSTEQGDMIELLRNATLASQLGVRFLSGLVGNVAIPRQNGGATAYWLDENGAGPTSDQSFDQITLSPKRLFAATAFSKQLLAQTSNVSESFVRGDLMQVLGIELDRSIFNGSGSSGQPRGILNTPNIKTVTFGGAATYAKYVNARRQSNASNVLVSNPAFVLSYASEEKGLTIVRFASTAGTIISDEGTIVGVPVKVTNQLPGDRMLYGANWSDTVVGEWAGMDVVVDPFTLASTGKVKVTLQMLADVGVRHPESYCASTDSAAA